MKKNKFLVTAVLIGVFGVSAGAAYRVQTAQDEASNAQNLAGVNRDTLREQCVASKAPGGVRFVVAAIQRDTIKKTKHEIRQRKKINYHKFFPGVETAQLKRLVYEQNRRSWVQIKRYQAQIKSLLGIQCAQIYPPAK